MKPFFVLTLMVVSYSSIVFLDTTGNDIDCLTEDTPCQTFGVAWNMANSATYNPMVMNITPGVYYFDEILPPVLFSSMEESVTIQGTGGAEINERERAIIKYNRSGEVLYHALIEIIGTPYYGVVFLSHLTFVQSNGYFLQRSFISLLYVSHSEVLDCTFVDFRKRYQGALNIEGSSLSAFNASALIENCSFTNCSTLNGGGGLSMDNLNFSLLRCTFLKCFGELDSTSNGGAVYVASFNNYVGSFEECLFQDCSASIAGGAIYLDDNDLTGTLTFRNVFFVNNTVTSNQDYLFGGNDVCNLGDSVVFEGVCSSSAVYRAYPNDDIREALFNADGDGGETCLAAMQCKKKPDSDGNCALPCASLAFSCISPSSSSSCPIETYFLSRGKCLPKCLLALPDPDGDEGTNDDDNEEEGGEEKDEGGDGDESSKCQGYSGTTLQGCLGCTKVFTSSEGDARCVEGCSVLNNEENACKAARQTSTGCLWDVYGNKTCTSPSELPPQCSNFLAGQLKTCIDCSANPSKFYSSASGVSCVDKCSELVPSGAQACDGAVQASTQKKCHWGTNKSSNYCIADGEKVPGAALSFSPSVLAAFCINLFSFFFL